MGQLFLPENLPSIVRASGTSITLAATNLGSATRFNIGGQQYALSASLTLSSATSGAGGLDTGSLGVSQIWYVYLIVNTTTFAPALIASQSAATAGPLMPSGYGTAFKNIGQFKTDASSTITAVQNTGNRVDDLLYYKTLSANIVVPSSTSAEATDLAVTGLEVGALYEYHFSFNTYMAPGASTWLVLRWGDSYADATKAAVHCVYSNTSTGDDYASGTLSGFFVPDSQANFRIGVCCYGGTGTLVAKTNTNTVTLAGFTNGSVQYPSTYLSVKKIRTANLVNVLS